jgi:hypothetical protein
LYSKIDFHIISIIGLGITFVIGLKRLHCQAARIIAFILCYLKNIIRETHVKTVIIHIQVFIGRILFSINIGIIKSNNNEQDFINSTIVGLHTSIAFQAKYDAIILTNANGRKSFK